MHPAVLQEDEEEEEESEEEEEGRKHLELKMNISSLYFKLCQR